MKREGVRAALLFTVVAAALFACAYGALIALHGRWIAQMTGMVGEAALAARGYVPGIKPLGDPTFEGFARGYLVIALVLCLACAGFVCAGYLLNVRRRLRAERRLSFELDGLLKGQMPDSGANSLLDEKKRQVLNALNQRSQEAEAEREKLKSLINDLSHQIKTPIASSRLYLELLLGEHLSDAERNGFLVRLGGQIDKTASLAGALVQLARLETGMIKIDMQPRDLCETVLEAISDIRAKAERKRIGIVAPPPAPWIVPHDRAWTKEVIVNILDNAVKYTPQGGRIDIALEPGAVYARIDIRDSGIGIPPSEHQRVFERFYRGKDAQEASGEGSGLGLYIARDIMRLEGGSITVSSDAGQGACFSLFLQNC